MAKCFDVVGYIEPCNAVRPKYTGRALMIVTNGSFGFTFSTNGMSISGIGGVDDYDSFLDFYNKEKELKNFKFFPISIDAQNPFGVTVQGNTDSGRVIYTKTIPVSIPATRDGKAEEFIMGLQRGITNEHYVFVPERFIDEKNTISTEIFGVYSTVRLDPASVTRSEYENGSAWTFNLVCEEPVPIVNCSLSELSDVIDTLNV